MDDELVTQSNRLTSKGLSAIPEILTSPYYADDQGYSYEYRPVTHITFAIEHAFFGESAAVSHSVNLLLYLITCLLVFRMAQEMFGNDGLGVFPSAMVALLFTVHPMHVEAVASVKNREELLALLGGLMALAASLRYVRTGNLVTLILIPVALAFALLSKLSALSIGFLVPLVGVISGTKPIRTLMSLAVSLPVLVVTMWLRTSFSWPEVVSLAAVYMLSLAVMMAIRAGINPLKHLRANIRGTIAPESEAKPSMPLNKWRFITIALTGLSFNAYGISTNNGTWTLIGTALLLLHPIATGHWNRWLLTLAAIGLAAVSFSALNNMLHLPFYALSLAVIFLWGRSDWTSVQGSWPVALALMVGLMLVWIVGDLELGGLPSRLVFMALVFLSAHKKLHERWKWLGMFIAGLLAFAALLTSVKGFKPEILVLSVGVFAFNRLASEHRIRKVIGSALVLLALITVLPIFDLADNGLVHPLDDTILTETVAPNLNEPRRPQLDLMLGNDVDRPLSFAEYPLGFDADISTKLGTASATMGHYLKMMFLPWPQAFYYGFDEVPVTDMRNPWAILSATVHLLLLIVALILMRSHPILSFGIIAYLASIFLFSNLVSPVAGMIADRLTYVASFGLCMALGYVFHLLFEKFNAGIGRKVVTTAFALLLVGWGGMTIARNAQWKDALTLMRHDIKHVPNSAQAHNLLASHLMKNSFDPEYASEATSMRLEAIDHFKQSARIYPDFFNIWYDIARAYMIIGQPDNALPAYKEAHRIDSTFYDATLNIAMISEQRGNLNQAIAYYNRCLRINPEMQEPYANLSYLLFKEGRFNESIAVNEQAIALYPQWKDAYLNISRTYQAMGELERAREYAKLAQLSP